MAIKNLKKYLFILILASGYILSFGQGSVPLGIHYQAVARDSYGKELSNKDIDVRFSIISDNPLGTVVYQELHSKVTTSKYGVFSLIIGHGTPTGGIYGELSQVNWSQSFHYLKVEVKFESTFIDMGTMQFLAVPYALYAQKSLEPGPQGPKGETGSQGLQGVPGQKGDVGDPASDDQTLSFNGNNLSISGGNTVNLSTLNIPHYLSILGDTLSIFGGNKVGLTNQIQDLHLDPNNILKIDKNPNATPIDLTRFLDDKQQLSFNSVDNTLTITNGITPVNLSKYDQTLTFNSADNHLTISGGSTAVDLTSLKNDADADPTNEIQDLSFDPVKRELSLSKTSQLPINLTELKNDADADPVNEIQDIQLTGNLLTIDKNGSSAGVDLSKYLDNKDEQTLSYIPSTYSLSLTNGGSVSLGSIIAFKSKKLISTITTSMTDIPFIPETVAGTDEYNDGGAFNRTLGEFTAPITGIYTFNISYYADGSGGSRKLILFNTGVNEDLVVEIGTQTLTTRSITLKLDSGNIVKLLINTGTSTQTGTGSFSGYRVY